MLYFKVDVGMVPLNNVTWDAIRWTDVDTFYPVGTIDGSSFPAGDKTIETFTREGYNAFKNDFDLINLVPTVYDVNYYQVSAVRNGWLPNAGVLYPNLYAIANTPQFNGYRGVIYFKTLPVKKIWVANKGIYDVADDHTFSNWFPRYNGLNYSDQNFNFGFITNYSDGMPLSTAIVKTFYGMVNTTGTRGSYVQNTNEFLTIIFANDPIPDVLPSTDPYSPGGESDLAGGEGDFDNTSEPIGFPDLPTLSAVDTGFITLFNPSVSELRSLATFMWGPAFDLENWKKLFANPMDAILGLSIVPVHVPDGGQSNVKVGNIDTGISLNKAGSQYVEVDCGTLNINEYWGAYLDYEPYTHVQIYLPYIGTKEISTDDVMNKPVHVKYHVDILSGSCVAYIKCGESVLYSFNGQCAASIPVTGRDYTNVVNSAISLVSSVMGMFAMGQAAGALGSAAGLAKSATSQARLAAGAARMESGMFSGGANIASSAIDITKPVIQKSGSVSSMAGLLGIQTPYMVLTRPRQCLPRNQNKYLGYPSLITSPLSSCSGFTRVEAIHLENIGATDEEIAEIESILHSGVIF